MSEGTEKPTARRLEQAEAEGNFARGRMLGGAFGTALLFTLLPGWASESFAELTGLARLCLRSSGVDPGEPSRRLLEFALRLAFRLAVPLLAAAAIALGIGIGQVGFSLHPERLTPKPERFDPIAGGKRLFAAEGWLGVALGLVLLALAAREVAGGAFQFAAQLAVQPASSAAAGMGAAFGAAHGAWEAMQAFALLFAGAEYGLARFRRDRSLRMTKEEVKREHREQEGDPHEKAKRKRFHKQLVAAAGAGGVKAAQVVVVNPTHVAVALRYDERTSPVPMVVARGWDADALAIRTEAQRNGVPLHRDIPLARTLVNLEVGEEVPEELYVAVATVLAAVMAEPAPGAEGETP